MRSDGVSARAVLWWYSRFSRLISAHSASLPTAMRRRSLSWAGIPPWYAPDRRSAQRGAHLAQALDPLLDRRVGGEEAGDALALEGLDDVERLGCLVDLHWDVRRPLLEAQQGAGQRLGVAADRRAAGVGRVLALARDRELDDARGDRRQQDHRQRGDQAERRVVVVAEPEHHVGEVGDRGADRRGDRLDQDVAVLDVRQLVREDAAQLVIGEQVEDPARHRHRGVLRVAAGGEGVGLVLRDHVEAVSYTHLRAHETDSYL